MTGLIVLFCFVVGLFVTGHWIAACLVLGVVGWVMGSADDGYRPPPPPPGPPANPWQPWIDAWRAEQRDKHPRP